MSIPFETRKFLRNVAAICLNSLPIVKDPLCSSPSITKTNKGSLLLTSPETVALGLDLWRESAQDGEPYAKIFLLLEKIANCGEDDDSIWNEILSDILRLLSDSSFEMTNALDHSLVGTELLSELRKIYEFHCCISNRIPNNLNQNLQ